MGKKKGKNKVLVWCTELGRKTNEKMIRSIKQNKSKK